MNGRDLLGRVFDAAKLQAWLEGQGKLPLSWAILGLGLAALMLGCAVGVALGAAILPRVLGAILLVGAYLFYIGRAIRSVAEAHKLARKAQDGAEMIAQAAEAAFREAHQAIDQVQELAEAIQTGRGGLDDLARQVEEARREADESKSRLAAVKADVDRLTAKRPPSPRGPGGWAAVFDWQASRQPRVTDKELGKQLGYVETTIKTERYKLKHQQGANDLPKPT